MPPLLAADIMTTEVVTVPPSTTVQELADILGRRRNEETVEAIMTTDVVAVTEEETVQEVAFLLSVKRINRVPVMREGRLVGIVSRTDIVKAMAGIMPERAGEP